MKGQKQAGIPGVILLSYGIGLLAALAVCAIGSVIIQNQILEQQWDFAISAAALVVWCVISYLMMIKRASLKKWFAAVFAAGGILLILLVGNLLTKNPDLELLPANALLILSATAVTLLLSGRKKKNYRIRY